MLIFKYIFETPMFVNVQNPVFCKRQFSHDENFLINPSKFEV